MEKGDKLLSMREAAEYVHVSYRWLQRNLATVLDAGCKVYRIPNKPKGQYKFSKQGLDRYVETCAVTIRPR